MLRSSLAHFDFKPPSTFLFVDRPPAFQHFPPPLPRYFLRARSILSRSILHHTFSAVCSFLILIREYNSWLRLYFYVSIFITRRLKKKSARLGNACARLDVDVEKSCWTIRNRSYPDQPKYSHRPNVKSIGKEGCKGGMEGNSGYGRLRQAPPAAIHIRYTKFLQLAPSKLERGASMPI